VVRPAPDLPDALFLGYLVGIYKTTLISRPNANGLQKVSTDDDDDDDTPRKTNRYIVALTRRCLLPKRLAWILKLWVFSQTKATKRIVVVISCLAWPWWRWSQRSQLRLRRKAASDTSKFIHSIRRNVFSKLWIGLEDFVAGKSSLLPPDGSTN
jgi:hypothetical protein